MEGTACDRGALFNWEMKQRPREVGEEAMWLSEAGRVLKVGAEGGKAGEAGPRLAPSGCSKEGSVAGMSGKGEGGYET